MKLLNLFDFRISPDRKTLTITADDETKRIIRENRDDHDDDYAGTDKEMFDLFDDVLPNCSFEWVNPSETGDLTEAPMLGLFGEDEEVEPVDNEVPAGFRLSGHDGKTCRAQPILWRWAWMSYAVESLIDHLLEHGEAHLTGGPLVERPDAESYLPVEATRWEHPDHPWVEYNCEVNEGATLLSYVEWVKSRLNSETDTRPVRSGSDLGAPRGKEVLDWIRAVNERETDLSYVAWRMTPETDVHDERRRRAAIEFLSRPCGPLAEAPPSVTDKPLPPDPEGMNEERAGWAKSALDTFASATRHRPDDRDWQEILEDFLANAMHFADREGIDFDAALDMARCHYEEETAAKKEAERLNAEVEFDPDK